MSAANVVRDMRHDERAAVRALTLEAYAELADLMEPDAWRELHAAVLNGLDAGSNAQRIVAESDGTLVGSVMLFPAAADAYGGAGGRSASPELRLLAVRPGARRQGVGEALVRECVRRSREAGAASLGLHTSRSMAAAIRMYERMGFRRVPDRDFQPPGAELVTAYELPL